MTEYLINAIVIATIAHRAQFDKAGKPYILHPLRVMLRLDNETDMIVGVLHDTIEDTDVTPVYLQLQGFPPEIIEALDHLTHRTGEDYDAFIERVKSNAIARRVKLADLADNADVSRLVEPLSEADLARTAKYEKAIAQLS